MRSLTATPLAALVGALALVIAIGSPARGQAPVPGTIDGVVRDGGGTPVPSVEVLAGTIRTTTDSAGRFRLVGLPAGRTVVQARRLGYRAASEPVIVRAGETVAAAFALMPIPQELDAVVVAAETRPGARRLRAFYERRQRNPGYFLTRDQLEPFDASPLSQALRSRVPSVSVQSGMGRTRLRLRNGRCAPMVWIDGMSTPSGEFDVDVLATNTIGGIEVYSGPATIPPEFRTPFGRDGCGGAIVIWSRTDLRDGERDSRDARQVAAARRAAMDSLQRAVPIYHADEVDAPARVDSTRLATPAYPDSLFAFDIRGNVVAEFVIDTTGLPMVETIAVVNATHNAFGESVRRAVAESRFYPARKGGLLVRQVMLLPFQFTDVQRRKK